MRSGYISIGNSKLRYSGRVGYSWSFMSGLDLNTAYGLYFGSDGAISSNDKPYRNLGFPLRCLAS